MNSMDWVVVLVILISMIIGVVRGIIKEILKLINLGTAIVSAFYFKKYLEPILGFIKVNEIRSIIAGVLIFIFMFILGSMIIFLALQMLNTQGIGRFFDKFLGFSYGVTRGLAIAIIAVTMLEKNPSIIKQNWWQKSATLIYIKKMSNFVPGEWKKLDKLS